MSGAISAVPRSFSEVTAQLNAESAARSPCSVTELPLKAIKTATEVFQPRDVDHAFLASHQHTKALTDAIQDAQGHVLEPLVVWWSGKHWYVIDGHHRLDAYRAAEKKVQLPAIPVRVFDGSLHEAIRESALLNCRDKLRMSKEDKLERAWKLVCLPNKWTKASIHEATGASERTVGNMRQVKAEMIKEGAEGLLDLTWAEAKRGEPKAIDETWEERQAIEWQKRLAKAFGTKLAEQPEIAARALQLYSDRLPRELVSCWPQEAQSVTEERRVENEESDF